MHAMLRYHRRSIRLKDFDYSQPGGYFITICTHNRKQIFGEINNFVIMPDHIHGIIVLKEETCGGTLHHCGGTLHHCGGTLQRAPTVERFGKPTRNSIPTIVRLYKSATTKRINEYRSTPACPVWQRNYYEHVIRNEREFNAISEYIIHNPRQWQFDRRAVTPDEDQPSG